MARRVDIVGGGPGGLYLSVLLKLASPRAEVRVFERQPPGETFGFGVGLSGRALERLGSAEVELRDALLAAAVPLSHGRFAVDGERADVATNGNVAIERARLLDVLAERASMLGVARIVGDRVDAAGLDADVVVAADGAASATRRARAAAYGAHERLGRQRFVWCGTDAVLPGALYTARTTAAGTFVLHAYPYRPDRSTVLVECDERTWQASGMAAHDAAAGSAPEDHASLRDLAELFADVLGGRPLLGNRTRWRRFATVACARWTDGRVTLLGDAAHTAHYSVGSGTRLAMEDAIGLAAALGRGGPARDAVAAYEVARRPEVERLQALARRSELWWDAFPHRLTLGAPTLALSFLTRTGRIGLDAALERNPALVDGATRSLADRAAARAATGTPVDLEVPDRFDDAWGPDGDALVDRARLLVGGDGGVLAVRRRGAADPVASLDLCERLRLELGVPVGWRHAAGEQDDARAALLSGRIDQSLPLEAAP